MCLHQPAICFGAKLLFNLSIFPDNSCTTGVLGFSGSSPYITCNIGLTLISSNAIRVPAKPSYIKKIGPLHR